jgi:hypothetical protein
VPAPLSARLNLTGLLLFLGSNASRAVEYEAKIDVVVMNPRALTEEQRAFLATVRLERIA